MRYEDRIEPLPRDEAYMFIPPSLTEAAIMELEALLTAPSPDIRLAAADTVLRHARLGRIDVEPGTLNPLTYQPPS